MTSFLHDNTHADSALALGDTTPPAPALQRPALAAHPSRPTVLLEALLATRLELLSRERVWPPRTRLQRQQVLLQLWAERPEGLFEQHGTAGSIEQCLHDAFASAAAGEKVQTAMALKRAYYLVCCTVSAGPRTRVRIDAGALGGHS